MINSVEIKEQTNNTSHSIKGSIQASYIAQVVEEAVNYALHVRSILVKFINYAACDNSCLITCVGRGLYFVTD